LLETILLCLISIVIEAVSTTKDGKQWFENLKQPKYSLPFSFWYVVGGLYYIICGIIAYRQFAASNIIFSLPIIILAVIMIINGLTNLLLFRFRSLETFYWVIYPFMALLISLIAILLKRDVFSAWLAFIYLAWLMYDLYYLYNLWKLNV